jgi:3-isopropylmalate/(R)-2-methylmalate dehydratase small subunit
VEVRRRRQHRSDVPGGSSRPAAKSLSALGITCVLADSLNGLFLRNSINFGLPAIPIPGVSAAFEEPDEARIDLPAGEVRNLRTGQTFHFSPLPGMVLEILDRGGLMPVLRERGYVK